MKHLAENKHGHGAVGINPLYRKIRRIKVKRASAGEPFDWKTGYNIEEKVGKIAIKDQGQSSSCGGQAGSYLLEIKRKLRGIKEGSVSAKSVYAPIAYIGGGTTVPALETQLGARGGNLERDVPSYEKNGMPLPEYKMIEQTWKTEARIKDAIKRAGFLPVNIPINIESIAQAIRDYDAVIIEIQGKNNGSWRNKYPQPPKIKKGVFDSFDSEMWAHFMCSKGAKTERGIKQIDFYNSWGIDVGDNGVQSFTEDYINSGYIVEVIAFIDDSKIKPIVPYQGTLIDRMWAATVDFFRHEWGLI